MGHLTSSSSTRTVMIPSPPRTVTITSQAHTVPTGPPPSHQVKYLASPPGASESNPTSSEDYGTGFGKVGGAVFEHSVLQLYGQSCCTESRSQTFTVPEGYIKFSAWIGVATGGKYEANFTPAMTFEVAVENPNDPVLPPRKLSYGDAPQQVVVSVKAPTSIILTTTSDTTNCAVCNGEAIWGEAKLSS